MILEMRRLLFLLIVVVALAAPTAVVAAERTVSVSATVERQVPNDAAEVHFSVSKERVGRAAALRIVAARVQAVIAASQGIAGVEAGDVTTGSISVRRVERGRHPIYRASEGVTVVTHSPGLQATWLRRELLPALRALGGPGSSSAIAKPLTTLPLSKLWRRRRRRLGC
jgi:uncharacterized protein YggE